MKQKKVVLIILAALVVIALLLTIVRCSTKDTKPVAKESGQEVEQEKSDVIEPTQKETETTEKGSFSGSGQSVQKHADGELGGSKTLQVVPPTEENPETSAPAPQSGVEWLDGTW